MVTKVLNASHVIHREYTTYYEITLEKFILHIVNIYLFKK